jgi:hypothetical protein
MYTPHRVLHSYSSAAPFTIVGSVFSIEIVGGVVHRRMLNRTGLNMQPRSSKMRTIDGSSLNKRRRKNGVSGSVNRERKMKIARKSRN